MEEQRLATILWRGRYLVLLAIAATVVVAMIATQLSARVYEATTLLRVDQSATGGTGSDTFNAQQASQALAGTYARMLDSRSFLGRIAPLVAGGRYDAVGLQQHVNAEAIKDTSLVSLSAEADSPAQAKRLAAETADQTIESLNEDSRTQLDEQQREIQARIASVTRQIQELGTPLSAADRERLESLRLARNALTRELGGVLGEGVARAPHISLSGPPNAPADPVEPRPLLNLVAALLLGSLIGIGLAWIRDRTSTKLLSSQEATALVQAPLLGSIPLRPSFSLDDPLVRNAFQVLHANIAAAAPDADAGQIVVVTSADPGAGKSSVARGLAEAAAHVGTDTLLVDGDLRRRRLSRDLGHGGSPGFSDAAVSADVAPQIVPVPGGAMFVLLPAGTPARNPSSILHSPGVRQLLEDLRQANRLIIVDTPPAGSLPDASILAESADCVLIVARTSATKRGHLTSVVNAFERRRQGRVVGLAVIEPGTQMRSARPPSQDLVRPAMRA
jgi:Mrp family chromosome partitioning ATPase